MIRLNFQRRLKALLFAMAATICIRGVDAQDEVVPSFTQEGFTFDFGFEPAKPQGNGGESPLRSVTFDDFGSVAVDETTDETADESPKAQPETEIVGNVKYDSSGVILLEEGQTYEIKTAKPIASFQTLSTETIAVEKSDSQKISVTAKTVGSAKLLILFKDKSNETHKFRVKSSSVSFESIIKQLFPKVELEIVPIRDTAVFLRGSVETEAEVQQIEEIAGEFWPTVHNHIQTSRNEPVYDEYKRSNSMPEIPEGMQTVIVRVMEWVQNPNGPQFNKIVSLYSTELHLDSLRTRGVVMGEAKLIGDNLQAFTRSPRTPGQVRQIALLVTEQQRDLINQAEQQGLRFFLVSQVVNESRPVGLTTQLNPQDSFLLPDSNRPLTPPPSSLVPSSPYVPTPDATPIYPGVELGVPQSLPPISQPTPKPSDPSQLPSYLGPASLPAAEFPQQPPTEFKNAPPTKSQQSDYPVPHSFDVPDPSTEFPSLHPNATPSPANSLQADVRALHTDVKNLINLLEKKQAKKEKKPVREETTEVIPKQGKAVLFFHAAWGGEPCEKMKPIVEKLRDEGLKIVSVDIAGQREFSKKYDVKNIPTFQKIEDGIALPNGQISGLITEEKLRQFVLGLEEHQSSGEASIFSFLSDSPKVMRITVQDSANSDEHKPVTQRSVTGSGILIQQSKGKATVLTTAHLFRGTKIDSENPILFSMTAGDTFINLTKQAKLVASDVDADLALIEIVLPELPFKLKPVHLSSAPVKKGSDVFFVGYTVNDEGLTRENGQITSVDKYAGPSNFQIAEVMATNGMSGSPVFDDANRLCGIVTAVDSKEKETFCTGLEPIKKLLKKAKVELPEDFKVEFTR